MKSGVVLLNTGWDAIIDEAAMAEAPERATLLPSGWDVHEQEPGFDARLVANEQTLLVPRLGMRTAETLAEALARMEMIAMENAWRGAPGSCC